MSSAVKGIFIVAAKRTPFGTYGGKFVKTSHTELQTVAFKAALTAANLKPEAVDSVVVGNVGADATSDGIFMARHAALKTGIPIDKPALAVNRLCGSGFQSVVNGCQEITSGTARIVLTGGTENMSQAPHIVRGLRFGVNLGVSPVLEDSLWQGLTDTYCKLPMGMTAEKLGAQLGVTREETDQFSLRSQKNWLAAHEAGRFKEELAPVEIKARGKTLVVDFDEHPKPKSTIEGMRQLKSVFKENGLVTAGSASGICDGAGAILLANEDAVKEHNLTPLARVVSYAYVGVDPSIMGIGPVPAITNALKVAGLNLKDMELVEINEAFAAQALACAKELKLDMDKFNVDGGAVALGHPLAASGSRITGHLVHELRRRKAKYGVGSACIGGGQGIAIVVEAL
ncbi:Thiolase, C-terminal domain [Popillia japonica]|uniref:Thiolase, C-terminal domain n=1 Tax=Popillia japonica TaxID=7064 RepID=A0AAW1JIR1_POPJA